MRTQHYHTLIYNLVLWSAAVTVKGFVAHGQCLRIFTRVGSGDRLCVSSTLLSVSNNDGNDDKSQVADEPQPMTSVSSLLVNEEQPTKPFPIDVPSPILLSASMILAIASTGSLFELMGGSPAFGLPVTAAIAAIGLPSCLYLFNASVLKAKAETEEDDAVFLGKKK